MVQDVIHGGLTVIVEHRKLFAVNVEQFLSFWSRHNTHIIEVLIGLILLTVVYLAFRLFFGGEASEAASVGALGTADLEKTLQRILENQSVSAPAAGGSEEIEKLKAQIAEKEKALEELKQAAPADGGAPAADSGAADALNAEKKKLEEKVKDLEARLAEYEIISEDIADLSFYKEENGKLQKELESLKAGAPAAPAAAAPTPIAASEPAPAPVPEADPLAAMAAAAEAAPVTATGLAEPTPAAEEPLVATAEPAPAKDPLDELLAQARQEPPAPTEPMAAEAAPAKKTETAAAPAAESEEPVPDDGKLMNQFADFVKKG